MDPRLIIAAQIRSIDDLYAQIDEDPPLHLAIEKGQTRLTLALLKLDPDLVSLQGIEVSCFGNIGETSLHIAVMEDRYEELEILLGWVLRLRQIDAESLEMQVLNRRNHNGNIALHLATYQNKIKAIKILLASRAKPLSGGKNANSLPKSKKLSEILRSRIYFNEYLFTNAARYRNQISDGSRSALLVIAVLIITTTCQTALQPPGGVYQSNAEGSCNSSKKSVGKVRYFSVLRIVNSMAFEGEVLMAFSFLPAGEEYVWSFLWIMVSLHISYLVSMSIISPDTVLYLPSVLVGGLRSRYLNQESDLILEGLTTLNQAKGV
ncbi:hypothetical protein EUTSA_v10029378mg [Eutrema salsugineum]|uniref:PGG domain-containing protein n=1 Tax=Eutrema salsugineum TaxID=72664 RepID=V4MZX7_EUTSA|nr:hypothetical protein EUTSA_v10029378mg [Eutrema salsugineum]